MECRVITSLLRAKLFLLDSVQGYNFRLRIYSEVNLLPSSRIKEGKARSKLEALSHSINPRDPDYLLKLGNNVDSFAYSNLFLHCVIQYAKS